MADGLYVGMAGAVARAEQLDAIADNLANAQTPGFKANRPAFEAFLPAAAPQGGDKVFPAAVKTAVDLRHGTLQVTGEKLDVVPDGDSFLAVQTAGGALAYTRAGRLQVDGDGVLRASGLPVVGRSGRPIQVPPGAAPEIRRDGMVTAAGQELEELALFDLKGPVRRSAPTLITPDVGGQAVPSAAGVRVGEVELGNAPALEAAVEMINAQRHYETSMQALATYKRLDEKAAEVGRVR